MKIGNKSIEDFEQQDVDVAINKVIKCSQSLADKHAQAADKARQLELTVGKYENYIDAVHHALDLKIREKQQQKVDDIHNQYKKLLRDLNDAKNYDRGINTQQYSKVEIKQYVKNDPFYGISGAIAVWHNINIILSFVLMVYVLIRGIVAVSAHNNVFPEIANDRIFIGSLMVLIVSCLIEIVVAYNKTKGEYEAINKDAREEQQLVHKLRTQRANTVQEQINAFQSENQAFFHDGKFMCDYNLIPVTRQMAEQALQEAINGESRPAGCAYQFQIKL